MIRSRNIAAAALRRRGRLEPFLLALVLAAALQGCGDSPETHLPAGPTVFTAVTGVRHFESILGAREPGPQLFSFHASWCPACRQLEPELERLARDLQEKAGFYSVDVDRNRDLAQMMRVRGIPLVVIVHEGRAVERLVGVHPREKYRRILERYFP